MFGRKTKMIICIMGMLALLLGGCGDPTVAKKLKSPEQMPEIVFWSHSDLSDVAGKYELQGVWTFCDRNGNFYKLEERGEDSWAIWDIEEQFASGELSENLELRTTCEVEELFEIYQKLCELSKNKKYEVERPDSGPAVQAARGGWWGGYYDKDGNLQGIELYAYDAHGRHSGNDKLANEILEWIKGILTSASAESTPTPEVTGESEGERDLNGLEIIIGDTYSPEVTPEPTNAWEEATGKYREDIMQTHNCTIVAKKVADWEEMQEVYISSVEAGEPVAQVFELDYRFIAKPLAMGLFCDLATLEELGVSLNEREHKDKWSPAVNKLMTKGKSIYGMRSEWMEPGGGIIFNKRLFEEAGLDPNLPYDLQARGEWTWSKFEEICEVLTRDTDGDGQTDVYATCSDGTDTLQCLVSSTGEDFIGVDKDGTIYNNCKSESVLGAMEYAATLYEKGYEMPAPGDEAEDWHITAFQNGKAAMQFGEESLCKPDAPYGRNNMTDEIGFVVPPKPDGQEEYYTYVYGNVWVIPSCYDAETAADIAFAYDLYTNETPGYNDPVSYQDAYYSDFEDERACDETLPYYNDKRRDTVHFLTRYLVDGLDISDLTKSYPFTEKTPEECVDELWDSWQALIDKSNGKQ